MELDAIQQLKEDFIICKRDWDLYQELFMQGKPRVNTLKVE